MELTRARARANQLKECGNDYHPVQTQPKLSAASGVAAMAAGLLYASIQSVTIRNESLRAVTSSMPHKQELEHYEVRVEGHLDDHWVEWFEHLNIARKSDGTTALSGPVADQAALHSLLIKIRDIGMVLISVRIISPPSGPRNEH